MQIKTMVVDDAVAIIMNLGLTEASLMSNRDFGVITSEATAAAR